MPVLQATLKPLDVQQTKDIETAVAGIRADKVKEKTASDAAKKGEISVMQSLSCKGRIYAVLSCNCHLQLDNSTRRDCTSSLQCLDIRHSLS